MYENFHKLTEEKQKKIINAAMREFSKFGYKKTSVEQIANAADISKSMIFHYFGNKQGLHDYLLEYSFDYSINKYNEIIDNLKEFDYIERYSYMAKNKLTSFTEEPELTRFLGYFYLHNKDVEISEKNKKTFTDIVKISQNYALLMHEEVENTKLRKDLDKTTSLKYIKWIMDGFTQELTSKLSNTNLADESFDDDWKDFDKILNDLRKIFYKE